MELTLYELEAVFDQDSPFLFAENFNNNTYRIVNSVIWRKSSVLFSPVIRIYGREVDTLSSVCVHVHGVVYFPYFYVKCSSQLSDALQKSKLTQSENEFIQNCLEDMWKYLCDRFKLLNNVCLIELSVVEKKCIYGYRVKPEFFLRINYNNPYATNNVDELIRHDKHIVPDEMLYESHIPYLVNFLADFRIYGMDKVLISHYQRRRNSLLDSDHPEPPYLLKATLCEIEIDVHCDHIVVNNRHCQTISQSIEYNPTIREICLLENQRNSSANDKASDSQQTSIFNLLDSSLRENKKDDFLTPETSFDRNMLSEIVKHAYNKAKNAMNEFSQPNYSSQYESLFVSSCVCDMLTQTPNENVFNLPNTCVDLSSSFMGEVGSTDHEEEFLVTSQQLHNSIVEFNSQIDNHDMKICSDDTTYHKDFESNYEKYLVDLPRDPTKKVETLVETDYLSYSTSNKILLIDPKNREANEMIPLFESHSIRSRDIINVESGECTLIGSLNSWPVCIPQRNTLANLEETSFIDSQIKYTLKTAKFSECDDEIQSEKLSKSPVPSVMCIELYADSNRNIKTPDPNNDSINLIVMGYRSCVVSNKPDLKYTIFLNKPPSVHGYFRNKWAMFHDDIEVVLCTTEVELLESFVSQLQKHDPDIILAYDGWMKSIGYFIDRCYAIGRNDLVYKMSRLHPFQSKSKQHSVEGDPPNTEHYYHTLTLTNNRDYTTFFNRKIHLSGRIVILLWKMLSIKYGVLHSYSLEYAAEKYLQIRLPIYSRQTIHSWWYCEGNDKIIWVIQLCNYLKLMVDVIFALLDKINILNEATESSKLTGIPLMATLTRGSQIKVQSLILHVAKCENYILSSPSRQQVQLMNAPMYLPFIIEPTTQLINDPVIVLDFQSLYPSIIIAYNLCYSTCLGSIENIQKALNSYDATLDFNYNLGYLNNYSIDGCHLKELFENDQLFVSPNGMVFVRPIKFCGILPRLLNTILKTRKIVKMAIKNTHEKHSVEILDCRQLALKLILNLTYGLTAANFSGYLPCVEIADTIICIARQMINKVINLITHSDHIQQFQPKVVYGDTDSVFIKMKCCTAEQAFKHIESIVDDINSLFTQPIAIKFEKVYMPCFLQSKKRYVGYSYENSCQKTPLFDAKGIETVRHDFCPASAKILKRLIRLLFENKKFHLLKSQFQQICCKILDGRCNFRDFMISRQFKGLHSSQKQPILTVVENQIKYDPLNLPQKYWRLCYLFVNGPPRAPLYELAKSMDQLIYNNYNLNSHYYILKQIIPPLDRFLGVLGVNVHEWYLSLPRFNKIRLNSHVISNNEISDIVTKEIYNDKNQKNESMVNTIWNYYQAKDQCILCGSSNLHSCSCGENSSTSSSLTHFIFNYQLSNLERKLNDIESICGDCSELYNFENTIIPCENQFCSCFNKKISWTSKRLTLIKLNPKFQG